MYGVTRALYGLVESARQRYQELTKTLVALGFTVTEADRGLFVKKIYRDGICPRRRLQ